MDDHAKRLRFRELLRAPSGSIAPGAADPLFARMVQDCGYPAVHLSGNLMHKSLALADAGLVTMPEVAERTRAIAEAVDIPLMIDGETGYGGPRQIARAVRRFERAGAAAIRFEDRLPQAAGKQSMPVAAMVEKIKAAVNARGDEALALVIRCDARESESFEQMGERLARYVDAGADAVGAQLSSVEEFRRLGSRPPAPLVSHWPKNLMTAHEFLALGYKIALVPSSVAIAATAAARALLLKLKETGDEKSYFQDSSDIEWVQSWYGELGKKKGKP